MPKSLTTFLVIALGSLALFASVAQADPADYAGSSADGSKVFFTTTAKLVPGDTDNGFRDVYERLEDTVKGIETYVTREISTGPTGGNDSYHVDFGGVSDDGSKVSFSTAESLVAEDEDHSADVYMRNTSTGATTLVSRGAAGCAPTCGNNAFPVTFVGATSTGSKTFFITNERMAEGDGDEAGDIYVRDLGATPATTTLVSRVDPSCGGCTANASVSLPVIEGKAPISVEGTKVVFESTDKLAAGDSDGGENDIYERDLTSGKTTLVSIPGTCNLFPASLCAPIYRGLSSDGTRVFIQTRAQLAPGDEDNRQDVYEWSAASPEAATPVSVGGEAGEGNGNFDAVFAGASSDGSKVFFETAEKLSGEDADAATDVYERVAGETKLASPGTAHAAEFNRASADGGTVLFSTIDSLAGADAGEMKDVYAWAGSTPALVSAGSSTFGSSFAGASQDASKVFYTTTAKLLGADKDDKPDIYEGPGAPVLVSTGPVADKGLDTPFLAGVSKAGDHAFFTTTERLTVDDNFAGEQDVYDHSAGGTLLVSVANPGELQLGPPAPGLTGTNPPVSGTSTEPAVLGEAEPGSAIKLYATADCFGAPVGIGTAAGTGDPAPGTFSITVAVAAGSTTTFRATATNESGDSSGCSTSSITYRQEISAPPPPPSEEGSGGSSGGGSAGGTGGSTGGSGGSTNASTGGSGDSGGAIRIGGIVYVAPVTRITFGPASKTRSRRPVFRFVDATEQPGTDFICKVDRRAWKGCSSPFKLPRLKPGRHVFSVKGRSAAGQWEQKPVTRKLKVVR
jgi:hypothetical protein